MLHLRNLIHQHLRQSLCVIVIGSEVVRGIDKSLIDGIHMDVIRREILEINSVDIRRIVDVQLHSGKSGFVLNMLWYLVQTAAVLHALRFHPGTNGKTEGTIASGYIRHDQICLKWIQTTLGTFDRCIEGLHVDA